MDTFAEDYDYKTERRERLIKEIELYRAMRLLVVNPRNLDEKVVDEKAE